MTDIPLTRDHLERELGLLKETLTVRIDASDKAAEVLAENVNRVPTLLDREILRVTQLFDEKFIGVTIKFDGILVQFRERDQRATAAEIAQKEMAIAQGTAASTAVAAALQAQKEATAAQNASNSEAINKSEISVGEQLKGIQALLASNNSALNDKIAVINGRLDRGEGGNSAHSSANATYLAVSAVIISLVIGGFSVLNSHSASAPSPSFSSPSQQGVIVSPAIVKP